MLELIRETSDYRLAGVTTAESYQPRTENSTDLIRPSEDAENSSGNHQRSYPDNPWRSRKSNNVIADEASHERTKRQRAEVHCRYGIAEL